jgi:hypothetical protein
MSGTRVTQGVWTRAWGLNAKPLESGRHDSVKATMPERTARRIQPEKDFTILRALWPYFADIPCNRLGN